MPGPRRRSERVRQQVALLDGLRLSADRFLHLPGQALRAAGVRQGVAHDGGPRRG